MRENEQLKEELKLKGEFRYAACMHDNEYNYQVFVSFIIANVVEVKKEEQNEVRVILIVIQLYK